MDMATTRPLSLDERRRLDPRTQAELDRDADLNMTLVGRRVVVTAGEPWGRGGTAGVCRNSHCYPRVLGVVTDDGRWVSVHASYLRPE